MVHCGGAAKLVPSDVRRHVLGEGGLSPTTVETHRAHILQKLGLHSVPELILYAVRKGIIS